MLELPKPLALLALLGVALHVVTCCRPGEYRDDLLDDCFSCDDVCDPVHGTVGECRRREECEGIIGEALVARYTAEKVTAGGGTTEPPCAPGGRALDAPLVAGLSVVAAMVVIGMIIAAFFCGKRYERNVEKGTSKSRGPFGQPSTEDGALLVPSGSELSTPADTAAPSPSGSQPSLDVPDRRSLADPSPSGSQPSLDGPDGRPVADPAQTYVISEG